MPVDIVELFAAAMATVVVAVVAHMAVAVAVDMLRPDLAEAVLQARYVLYGLAVHVASQVHA